MHTLKRKPAKARAKKAPVTKKSAAKKASLTSQKRASATFDPTNNIDDFWEEVVAEHGPVLTALAK